MKRSTFSRWLSTGLSYRTRGRLREIAATGALDRPTRTTFRAHAAKGRRGFAAKGSQSLQRLQRKLQQTQTETILALSAAVEAKDPYTQRHSVHVSFYAERLGQLFHVPPDEIEVLRTAGLLHDAGKIGIPDAVLTKPGPLTVDEFRLIKRHPTIGAAVVQTVSHLHRVLPLVLHHHEWYDGSGYPHGLSGRDIPFGARILQVADSLDAMVLPRSYRRARTFEEVVVELRQGRGTQFDPEVADVAIEWLRDNADQLITQPRGRRNPGHPARPHPSAPATLAY